MHEAVSMEDALKLGAGRSLNAKIASAARGEKVSEAEMRRRAKDYETGDGGAIVLPISDGDRPTAFRTDEPLVPVVVDGGGRPLGRVVTGSGSYKPTGNEAADAALEVLAGATRVGPATSKAVRQEIARAGLDTPEPKKASSEPAGSPMHDPLAEIRRELTEERRLELAPQPKPDNSVLAQLWVKGTNMQLPLRCRRAFIDKDGYLPLLVLVVLPESDVGELPVNRQLGVTQTRFFAFVLGENPFPLALASNVTAVCEAVFIRQITVDFEEYCGRNDLLHFAEAEYGIPEEIRIKALGYLSAPLREYCAQWRAALASRNS